MNKYRQKILYIFLIGFSAGLLWACNFAPFQGEAQVVLDLSWLTPGEGEAAGGARAATVQGAPDNIIGYITSIEITISGSGINTETRTYTKWPRYLSVSVPPGKQRTIGLAININPASSSPVLTFGGEANLRYVSAGEQEKVLINIIPQRSKLLVPDLMRNRLLQFDNINDNSSTVYGPCTPYDVDIDKTGRIYMINNGNQVYRIDDIAAGASVAVTAAYDGMLSISIDKKNNILYCAAMPNFRRVSIATGDDAALKTTGLGIIKGMHVADDGFLYLVCDFGNSCGVVVYDPDKDNGTDPATGLKFPDGGIINTFDPPINHFFDPWDILVKDNYIYISNRGGGNGWQIIRIPKSLDNQIGFGDQVALPLPDIGNGKFYGPRKFVAKINERITIIDDYPNASLDKLISINDVPATDWQTFPSEPNDDGQKDFFFYSN